MGTEESARVEDLYDVEGQAEIVNGKIVRLPFHTMSVGRAVDHILISLWEYAEEKGLGHGLGSTVAYIVDLPHRKAFCPDVALTRGPLSPGFGKGAPVFVAEVRDQGDYSLEGDRPVASEPEITAKRADYFAAGTQVVWDVDLESEDVVRVYRADNWEQPTVYRRGDIAEAEPAVPGWTFSVDDLFRDEYGSTSRERQGSVIANSTQLSPGSKKLASTALWCCALLFMTLGLATFANMPSGAPASAAGLANASRSATRELSSVEADMEVSSFAPWLTSAKGGNGLAGAQIEIAEVGGDRYSDASGGRITLANEDGEHIVTARVVKRGVLRACNPRERYLAVTTTIEMIPSAVTKELTYGDFVHGSLYLQVGQIEYVFKLPRTQVDISPAH